MCDVRGVGVECALDVAVACGVSLPTSTLWRLSMTSIEAISCRPLWILFFVVFSLERLRLRSKRRPSLGCDSCFVLLDNTSKGCTSQSVWLRDALRKLAVQMTPGT